MTERKVLNKYYPPDYDPRKLPKPTREERLARKWVQRVMIPYNARCNTCGVYIYKGKKFNARRERVWNEEYLGLAIWRFYIRCPQCLAEITFKTDLKNCDYAAEHGATRLFEAEKIIRSMEKEEEEKEEQDKQDPMKMLEKRTKMSRFEMDALARLEELKELNQRQAKVNFEAMISVYRQQEQMEEQKQQQEDEEFVNSLFGSGADGALLKRIIDDQSSSSSSEDEASASTSFMQDEKMRKRKNLDQPDISLPCSVRKLDVDVPPVKKSNNSQKRLLEGVIVRKPAATASSTDEQMQPVAPGSLGLVNAYGSDDSNSE